MIRYIALLVGFIFSINATAGTVEIEYKSFYSHLRKLNDEDMNLLQFSFGLQHIETGVLCEITSAHISTQKKQLPIDVTSENRFTLPQERALRLADALVIVTLAEPTNKCDMSVQLETKASELKTYYDKPQLTALFNQYAAFFEDMGGFFSFMMPSVNGLVFHFEETSVQTLADGLEINNGRLVITENQIAELSQLELNQKPIRITAQTGSS